MQTRASSRVQHAFHSHRLPLYPPLCPPLLLPVASWICSHIHVKGILESAEAEPNCSRAGPCQQQRVLAVGLGRKHQNHQVGSSSPAGTLSSPYPPHTLSHLGCRASYQKLIPVACCYKTVVCLRMSCCSALETNAVVVQRPYHKTHTFGTPTQALPLHSYRVSVLRCCRFFFLPSFHWQRNLCPSLLEALSSSSRDRVPLLTS